MGVEEKQDFFPTCQQLPRLENRRRDKDEGKGVDTTSCGYPSWKISGTKERKSKANFREIVFSLSLPSAKVTR